MKTVASLIVVVLSFCWKIPAQCPAPTYTNNLPLPAGSTVTVVVDSSGGGVSSLGISITPNPSNSPPKFSLSGTASDDLIAGVTNWNGQPNNTGVSFQTSTPGSPIGSPNAIISPTWPRATVSYYDTSGNQHTVNIDFSSLPGDVVAASVPLNDFSPSGVRLTTSAGFVTLINTNGSYVSVVNGQTYAMWSPTGANFDGALIQIGEHETGHQFLLGDQSVSGDIMSSWKPTVSNPGGATNNQTGNASSTITDCDNNEIQNNPNAPYNPPPPPPPPPPGDCHVEGCTCGGTCEKDGSCTFTFGCSPIVIAVGKDGDIELTSAEDGVWFDIEANGKPQWVGWTQKGEPIAFLAHDVNHDGRINDGSELFGNHTLLPNGTVAPNGFAALAAYDRPENGGNGDGVIDAKDAIWGQLRLWIDWNHDGRSEPNEIYRLEDWGVRQISLDYESINRADKFGNVFRFKAACQLAGKVRFGYDVYFTARPPRRP